MKVKIEPYKTVWKEEFAKVKNDLEAVLRAYPTQIDHIGSTSVEGLSAKPIFDILVGVADSEVLDKLIEPLVNKGYVYDARYNEAMPYRRFFIKTKNKPTRQD